MKTQVILLAALLIAKGAAGQVLGGAKSLTWRDSACEPNFPLAGAWRTAIGYGSGQTPLEAETSARENAGRRLLDTLTAALTEVERALIESEINTSYSQPAVETRPDGSFGACAFAIVEESRVTADALRAGLETFDAALRARWSALVRAAGGRAQRVYLAAPCWQDGADADELGRQFLMHFQGAPVPGLGFVYERSRAKVEVRTALGASQEGCAVTLQFRAGQGAWEALEVLRFSPRVLGLQDCRPPAETHLSNRRLGLSPDGTKLGSRGLVVRLDVPKDGVMCEGRRFPVHVTTTEPAYIAVVSVLEDGRVIRSWAPKAPVTEWRSPVEEEAIAMALRGPSGEVKDRMVALAVPAGLGPEALDRALPPAGCFTSLGTGLDVKRLPPEAAAAATMVSLVRAGRESCPPLTPANATLVSKLHEAVNQLPTCGTNP